MIGNSSLVIDDISIDSGDCISLSNMFNCSQTEWVPMSKVCNYVTDCTNAKDEQVCGSCNFENKNLCGYTKRVLGLKIIKKLIIRNIPVLLNNF